MLDHFVQVRTRSTASPFSPPLRFGTPWNASLPLFSAMRNPGADQTFTDLAAVVQLRLRVAVGLQALQRCSPESFRGKARGSTVATHHPSLGTRATRRFQAKDVF